MKMKETSYTCSLPTTLFLSKLSQKHKKQYLNKETVMIKNNLLDGNEIFKKSYFKQHEGTSNNPIGS
jgi:hypothetical protein